MDNPKDNIPLNQLNQLNQTNPPNTPKPKKNYDKKIHGKRYPKVHDIAIKAMKDFVDNGQMTVTDVARQTNSSRMKVYRVWEDPELDDLSTSVVSKTKKGLTGLFYKRALEATKAISPSKLDQASALQLATVAGIMTEKGRLMENLSTENVSHRGFIDNLNEEKDKIVERLKQLDD